MLKFAWKWFGLKKLKALLDKLPANGKKTYINVLLVILSVASAYAPEYASIIDGTVQYLKDAYEVNPAATIGAVSGAVGTAVGLGHKGLKAAEYFLASLENK